MHNKRYKSKFEMSYIIKDKIHAHINTSTGKFFHYATILPSVIDAGWWEKSCIGSSENITHRHMPSKHAEIDAYNKIRNYKNMPKKIDIFVIRLTKLGILAESRPCYHCLDFLEKSGLNIKYVYYSTSDGNIDRAVFKNIK